MANKQIIYIDDEVQEVRESKVSFTGISEGPHVLKIESYDGETLLDTAVRNITVPAPNQGTEDETIAFMEDADVNIPNDATVYYGGTPQETTGAELWAAIDSFIKREKAAGRWFKLGYFRPRVGGTAVSHAVNLVDPQTFRGLYLGSWIHDGMSSQSNGANAYMRTYYEPFSEQVTGQSGMGFTMLEYNNLATSSPVPMGAFSDPGEEAVIYSSRSDDMDRISIRYNSGITAYSHNSSVNGVQIVNRVSNQGSIILNGSEIQTFTASGILPDIQMYEGAMHYTGQTNGYFEGRLGCTFQLNNFSTQEAIDFSVSVEQLETDLKRKVW